MPEARALHAGAVMHRDLGRRFARVTPPLRGGVTRAKRRPRSRCIPAHACRARASGILYPPVFCAGYADCQNLEAVGWVEAALRGCRVGNRSANKKRRGRNQRPNVRIFFAPHNDRTRSVGFPPPRETHGCIYPTYKCPPFCPTYLLVMRAEVVTFRSRKIPSYRHGRVAER